MVLKAIFLEFRGVLIDDRLTQARVMQDLLLDQNLSLKPQEYEDLIKEEDDRSCLQILLDRRGRSHTVDELNQLLQKRFEWTEKYLNRLDNQPHLHHNSLSHNGLANDSLPQGDQGLAVSSAATTAESIAPAERHRSSWLLPDVKDFLFRARALSYKLVLMTSSIEQEVNSVLNAEQISPYFDLVLPGEKLPYQPIKPQAYTYALQCLNETYPNLNLTPHNCLAIESLYRHCDAARSVGISVAAVSRYRPIHFLQRRADWTVDRLTDLEFDRINASLSPSVGFRT
jgi:beta-phosphoglucomutase